MRFLLFLLLSLSAFSAAAQTDTTGVNDSLLNQLVRERARLFKDWEYFQQQHHALFGGQSKNDLRNIIATLEGILAKDNQILGRLRTVTAKERQRMELEKMRLTAKTGELTTQTNSFLGESNQLAERTQRLEARLKAEKEARRAAEARIESTFQIAVAAVLGALVLAWLGWRRGRRRNPAA